MGITVAHEPSPSVIGAAGFGVGQGRRQERDIDRARQDSQFAARLAAAERAQQAAMVARAREGERNRQFSADRDTWRADELAGRTEREMTWRQEAAAQNAQQAQGLWDYQYSSKQRRQIEQLNQARQTVADSPHLSDPQKQEALRQIDLRQAGIQPQAIPRDPNKQQYPEGQDVGQQWRDEATGALLTRDPDGKERLLVRPDQTMDYLLQKQTADQQKMAVQTQTEQRKMAVQVYKDALQSFTIPIEGRDGSISQTVDFDGLHRYVGSVMSRLAEPEGGWQSEPQPEPEINPDEARTFVEGMKAKVARGEQMTPQEVQVLQQLQERLQR